MAGDTEPSSSQKRAQRGSSGLPSGISKKGKRFQARLCYVPTGGTKKELRGVGTFETVDEAVAALAEAQRKFKEGGAAAVWQNEKETRAARGTVRMLRPNAFVIVIALGVCAPMLCSGGTTEKEAEAGGNIHGEDAGRWARQQSGQPYQPSAEGEEAAE